MSITKEIIEVEGIDFKFDKDKVILEFKTSFSKDNLITEKAAELNYIIRKFELNYDEFDVTPHDALNLLQKCSEKAKNDVFIMIGYMIEKCKEKINDEMMTEIRNLLSTCSNSTKLFLESQIEKNKDQKGKKYYNFKVKRFNKSSRRNPIAVEKTVQSTKTRYKRKEETEIKFLDFNKALKNTNKARNDYGSYLAQEEEGNDAKFYRTTWDNCFTLYKKTQRGQNLKKEDKEYFLPHHFLNYHYLISTKALEMWSFFTNRMISSMLSRISLKQPLNNLCIEKLMMCVVSFDEFITVLNFQNKNLVEIFKDAIFNKYSSIIAMKEPDVFKSFADQIINITIKLEKEKPKIKTFIKEDVEKIIKEEIRSLRLNAVTALYNSCAINQKHLTKDRIDKIVKCLNDKDDDDNSFKKELGKLFDLTLHGDQIDYNTIKSMFNSYLKDLKAKNMDCFDDKIRFIRSQSIVKDRCKKLFTDGVIETLVDTFKQNESQEIVEIIDNYVKTSFLSDTLLENIIDLCITNNNKAVAEYFFPTILLSVEKSKSLPQYLIKKLICNITDTNTNFIVLILSKVKNHECNIINDKGEFEILSKTLENSYYVALNEKIEFIKLSLYDSDELVISLLSSKIILDSINEHSFISETTIDNLINAIESNKDKQTQIYCAKCIHKISKLNLKTFNDHLNTIYCFIDSNVHDISVYMQAVYCKSLAVYFKSPALSVMKSLASSEYDCVLRDVEKLKHLSSLFLKDELNLGNENKNEEINGSIFTAFENAAKSHEFIDENFNLFEWLLIFSNEDYMKCVIQILQEYTKHHIIPISTIEALENSLGFNELHDITLLTFENVIKNNQPVGEKTLKIYFDKFFLTTTNVQERFKTFTLMERVRINQEMNENFFFVLELNKAAYGLSVIGNKKHILDFIKNLTDKKNFNLPIDLMDALKRMFSSDEHEIDIIEIFENVTKNEQVLPEELFDIMQSKIEKEELQEKILFIFVKNFAKKPEKISKVIFERIISKLALTCNKKYLSLVLSYAEKNQESIKKNYNNLIGLIIDKGLSTQDFYIQEACIRLFYLNVHSLDCDNIFKKLGNIYIDPNCTLDLKNLIDSLIDSSKVSDGGALRATQKLFKLEGTSNVDYLENVIKHFNDGGTLCKKNFTKLKKIIDEESNTALMIKSLDILKLNITNQYLPHDLDNSITSLMERFNNNLKIWHKCKTFLYDFKVIKGKCFSLNIEAISENKKQDEDFLNLFSEFHFGDSINTKLIAFLKKMRLKEFKSLEDFLENMSKNNALSYKDNAEFSILIKTYLKNNSKDENAMLFYARILKEQNNGDLLHEPLLETLVNEFQESCNLDLLIECIYNAILNPNILVPYNCYELLKQSIENKNPYIRYLVFKGLRSAGENAAYYNVYINKLETVLKFGKIYDIVFIKLKTPEELFNLLEVILSLNYIDFDVFCLNEEKFWRRELIISDLFHEFKAEVTVKRYFYKNWLEIEESKSGEESIKILSLIFHRRSFFKDFNQIIETIIYMRSMSFDSIMTQLYNFLHPYEKFKTDWCIKKINGKLRNRNLINETDYLNKNFESLAKLNIHFVSKLFQLINTIEDLGAFEELVSFCYEKNLDNTDLACETNSVQELKKFLHVRYICKRFNHVSTQQKFEETHLFDILYSLEKEWGLLELEEIIEKIRIIQSKDQFQNCIDLLRIVQQFNLLSSYFEQLLKILDQKSFNYALKKFHHLAVESYFKPITIKNSKEILIEFETLNKNNTSSLEHDLNETKNNIEKTSNWTEKNIKDWSTNSKTNEFVVSKAIAVINRAIVLHRKEKSDSRNKIFDRITDAQIISCLIALESNSLANNGKGKLLQLATGEGKSVIVCILAIINALKDTNVNVITSSPVLAERDAKSNEKLYKMFGLTCSDNNEKLIYSKGLRPCYNSNIVYGDISQFQFDTLRHEYNQLNTLGERKCEIAIIDEVDVMLIDDGSKIAKLASPIAGLNHFHAVYTLLWCRLIAIKEKLIQIDESIYFMNGKIDKQDGQFVLRNVKEDGEIYQINDLEEYLKKNKENISKLGYKIDGKYEEFLKLKLEEYLNELVEKEYFRYPRNFKEFFERQKPIWIKNAIEAIYYEENVDYIIQNDQIKPVDYSSTGVVLTSTHWSDGLHQFLQLKHNLKLTDESLTTNFLSNVSYIKNFKKIYGLTGTLGSPIARRVLENSYEVNVSLIPQTYKKQFIELPIIVKRQYSEWLNKICSSSMLEIEKERGVLIICETIESANTIASNLKECGASIVKLYTMNDMSQERYVEKINKGEIIVATMIAGRGTDINADEIEDLGGLHIILTFLPDNQRVEDQAFGRTARQGKPGTGQMILHFITDDDLNCRDIKNKRNQNEAKILEQFEQEELKLILKKDELFKKFCKFLIDFRDHLKGEIGTFEKIKSCLKGAPTITEETVLASVEEQWAYFLLRFDDKLITVKNADVEFEKFQTNTKSYWNIIQNPYHNIKIGNSYIIANDEINAFKYFQDALILKTQIEINEKIKPLEQFKRKFYKVLNNSKKDADPEQEESEGKKKESLSVLKECFKGNMKSFIGSNEDLSGASFVGLAYSILKKPAKKKEEIKAKKCFAIKLFEKALEKVTDEINLINSILSLKIVNSTKFLNSPLEQQFLNKSNLLSLYRKSIEDCVDVLEKSLRLIDLVQESTSQGVYYYGLERNEEGILANCEDLNISTQATYKLIFNDLTRLGETKDQAWETIEKVTLETKNTIQLKLKKVNVSQLKSLLNKNKEFKELTKSAALSILKAELPFLQKINVLNTYLIDLKIVKNNITLTEIYNQEKTQITKVLNSQNDTNDSEFNLIIKDSNKNDINENLCQENIQVVFENLDFYNAKEKLNKIKAQTISIEMIGKASDLQTIVSLDIFKSKQFRILDKLVADDYFKESVKYLILDQPKVNETINSHMEESMSITILGIDKEEAKDLSETFNKTENLHSKICFTITFTDFEFLKSFEYLNFGEVDFYVDHLNKSLSKKFIDVLRKENLSFSLEFTNLECRKVKEIIKIATLNQEDIEISTLKDFSKLFKADEIPVSEIIELNSKGIEFLIDIKENGSIPWRTIYILGSLALIQLTAGIVLCFQGYSANIGIGLIAEGINDIYMACRAYKTRKFKWKEYARQKGVSLMISLVSAGLSQNPGKKIVEGVTTELTEQGITQGLTNIKTVGAAFSTKKLQVASKQIGKGIAKGIEKVTKKVVKDKLTPVVTQALHHSGIINISSYIATNIALNLELINGNGNQNFNPVLYESQINESVKNIIDSKFLSSTICLLQKFYALDSLNKNKNYTNELNNKLSRIKEKIHSLLDKSIKQSLNDLVSKLNYTTFSEIKFISALKDLTEIKNSIDTILKEFTKMVIDIDKNHKMTKILKDNFKIEIKIARQYSEILQKHQIADENDIMNCYTLKDLKFKIESLDINQPNHELTSFLKSFCDKHNDIGIDEFSKIFKSISSAITEQLINIMIHNMRYSKIVALNKLPDLEFTEGAMIKIDSLNFFTESSINKDRCGNVGPSYIETLVERVRSLQDLNSII